MPQIEPFRPLRFNQESVPDPGAVIAPPYDVISEEKRQQLIARDPHNIIRLILPEGGDGKYAHAGELMEEWMRDGILLREAQNAMYVYSETFAHPVTGKAVERTGLMAAVRLAEFSEGLILPHERTLSGPKADRLALMETTDANLEPIFGVYRDRTGSSEVLRSFLQTPAWVEATDSDGVRHRLWQIQDDDIAGLLRSALSDNPIFIVDGHHRYETALRFRTLKHEKDPSLGEPAPVDFIMMFLAPSSDPGLIILPTHRVIHSLSNFDFDALINELKGAFTVEELQEDDSEILARLESHSAFPSFLLLSGKRRVLVALQHSEVLGLDTSLPEEVRALDVTVLHDYILDRLLGITREAQAAQSNLKYIKSSEEAIQAADDPANQLVVLMNATRLEQVESVAASGNVMPQKSTYFYPKLASGLLINPLWD